MTARGPIPLLFETAASARARGCNVPDVPDGVHVAGLYDRWPRVYAWSVWWSNGVRSGVREEGERVTPDRPPCAVLRERADHCILHCLPILGYTGVCALTYERDLAQRTRDSIATWLMSASGRKVLVEAHRAAPKGDQVAAIGVALAGAVLERCDLPLEGGGT